MSDPLNNQWKILDRDLGRFSQVELATQYVSRPLVGIVISLAFLVIAGIGSTLFFEERPSLIIVVAIWRLILGQMMWSTIWVRPSVRMR